MATRPCCRAGTELNEDALTNPREVFHSEALGGHKSYMINLGDLLFNSPSCSAAWRARRASAAAPATSTAPATPNSTFPTMSTRPGNFDTTGPLFNPKADNHVLDPVRIP